MLKVKNGIWLPALCFLGFFVSVAAGLEDRLQWLGALCDWFSSGCRETAKFAVLGLPVWGWGAAFYALTALFVYRLRGAVFWCVAGAFGVELSLVWIMITSQTLCVFCLANLLVVLFLVALSFEKARFWQISSTSLFFLLLSTLMISKPTELSASAPQAKAQDVVARVGDRAVSAEEIEKPLTPRLYSLEKEIYAAKRELLEQTIAGIVLQREADQQGVSLNNLIVRLIPKQQAPVGDQELESYYRQNRAKWTDWKGSEEELKERMRDSLQERKAYQAILDYAQSLYAKNGVEIYLKEPSLPNMEVNIANAPTLGPAEAPVTVVEFSDYLCPACRKAHEVTRQVREKYKGQIRWVFKEFPIQGHKWAVEAAEAARCAGEEGKFWEYQDILFASGDELHPDRLIEYAKQLGLDHTRFNQCLSEGRYRNDVTRSREEAKGAGVNSTPTFIINGKLTTGKLSLERFTEIIEEELKRTKGER